MSARVIKPHIRLSTKESRQQILQNIYFLNQININRQRLIVDKSKKRLQQISALEEKVLDDDDLEDVYLVSSLHFPVFGLK